MKLLRIRSSLATPSTSAKGGKHGIPQLGQKGYGQIVAITQGGVGVGTKPRFKGRCQTCPGGGHKLADCYQQPHNEGQSVSGASGLLIEPHGSEA